MEIAGKSDPSSQRPDETAFGVVIKALPDTLFEIELEGGKRILAYLAGKMRLHRIRVLVGDRVEILLDAYGGKGRIVRRL